MARRRRKRHREREQFWPQVLDEGQAGGQSVSAFCRARRLSPGSFYAWRREAGGVDLDSVRRRKRYAQPAPQ
jgi:hypothetical protein